MKTRVVVAVLLGAALLAGTAAAQVHGVPASVTSFAPGRGMAPGIPASVTSLGPHGFVPIPPGSKASRHFFVPNNRFNFCSGSLIPAALGCQNALNPPFFGSRGFGGRHFGPRGFFPGGVGVGAGYAYPYAYLPPYDYSMAEQEMTAQPEPEEMEPQGPAPTIFDRRGTYAAPRALPDSAYGERYRAPAEEQAPPAAAKAAVVPTIPTVLVFRDGHRQEVTSYAITGDTLYEIGPAMRTHKVKLADLDLQATVQANEANGIDFTVPNAVKPTHD